MAQAIQISKRLDVSTVTAPKVDPPNSQSPGNEIALHRYESKILKGCWTAEIVNRKIVNRK